LRPHRDLLSFPTRRSSDLAALVDCQHRDRIPQTHSLADLELGDTAKGFLVDDDAAGPKVPAGHTAHLRGLGAPGFRARSATNVSGHGPQESRSGDWIG